MFYEKIHECHFVLNGICLGIPKQTNHLLYQENRQTGRTSRVHKQLKLKFRLLIKHLRILRMKKFVFGMLLIGVNNLKV
jgi:hypothetical protein